MASATSKKCHYEVLELPRTATYDEIKSAYRRLALIHHPDKNGGSQVRLARLRCCEIALLFFARVACRRRPSDLELSRVRMLF